MHPTFVCVFFANICFDTSFWQFIKLELIFLNYNLYILGILSFPNANNEFIVLESENC